jgi:hypothetical protein
LFESDGISRILAGLKAKADSLRISVVPEKSDDPLIGEYHASGNNDDGTTYSGKVIISPYKNKYLVTWYIAEEHFAADGFLNGDEFVVKGDFDFTYEINEDGSISGEWAQGAFEHLVRVDRLGHT